MNRAPTNLAVTVIGLAIVAITAGLLWFGVGGAQPVPPVPDDLVLSDDRSMVVHVAGAVVRPGLVEVPAGSRVADVIAAAGGADPEADLASANLAAAVRDGERIVIPLVGVSGSEAEPGIDLNTAGPADLQVLPGVGPVLAQRIVAHREEHGFFVTIEDLLDVPGIGEAKLEGLRDLISAP